MLLSQAEEARNYLHISIKVRKVCSKVVLITSYGLFSIESITDLFRHPFRIMGWKYSSNTSFGNILLSIMPCSIKIKLGWPTSFMYMEIDAHLLYFTKLSGKCLDFYFIVGTHLKRKRWVKWWWNHLKMLQVCYLIHLVLTLRCCFKPSHLSFVNNSVILIPWWPYSLNEGLQTCTRQEICDLFSHCSVDFLWLISVHCQINAFESGSES